MIYVGGTGDITVIALDDNVEQTFTAVQAGTRLEVRARIVKATGKHPALTYWRCTKL